MKTLKEQRVALMREYARQVADLLGGEEWHYLGTDDHEDGTMDVCMFNEYFFLSFEDMQVIVERMDEWLERYGSKEAVAGEIIEWQDWWMEDDSNDNLHPILELWEERRERMLCTPPRICLEQWLEGCRSKPRQETPYHRLRVLKATREMVCELADRYGYTAIIDYVRHDLVERIDKLQKEVDELDRQHIEEFKQTDVYKHFSQALENNEEK